MNKKCVTFIVGLFAALGPLPDPLELDLGLLLDLDMLLRGLLLQQAADGGRVVLRLLRHLRLLHTGHTLFTVCYIIIILMPLSLNL